MIGNNHHNLNNQCQVWFSNLHGIRSNFSFSLRLPLYKDRKVFKRGWIRGTSGRIQPSRNYVSSRDRFRASTLVRALDPLWSRLWAVCVVDGAARWWSGSICSKSSIKVGVGVVIILLSFFFFWTSVVLRDFPRFVVDRCVYFQYYSSILVTWSLESLLTLVIFVSILNKMN